MYSAFLFVHGNICDPHQFYDIHELKQRLTKVSQSDLRQSIIDDAMDEWHKRISACVHVKGVKGGHFEHLLLFKSTHMLVFRSKSIILC